MNEPNWFSIARAEIGTREIEGPKSNSRIVEYAKVAIGKEAPDSEAWCAKFVGWALIQDGIEGTGLPNARSYLKWGQPLEVPYLGCVVVFWRGKRDGWQGHVGFFVKADKTHIWVVGGNQGNAVSIAKYPRKRLLGYRWPSDKAVLPPPPEPAFDPELKRLQAVLKEKGFHEVGKDDGLWGNKTRTAVRAFYDEWNDRHPDKALKVPAGGSQEALVTEAMKGALLSFDHRRIAIERETAEPEAIGDYAAVKEAKKSERTAVGGLSIGGIWVLIQSGIAEHLGPVGDSVRAIREFVEPNWGWIQPILPFVLVAAGFAVWRWARKIKSEEIESYRMGETP